MSGLHLRQVKLVSLVLATYGSEIFPGTTNVQPRLKLCQREARLRKLSLPVVQMRDDSCLN